MRVLIVHSRYLSGDVSGENRVVDDEAELLRSAGHEVDLWTPSPRQIGALELFRLGANAIWSGEAVHEIRTRTRRHRAEIVHCHNLFPMLSPAVARAARAEGVAVVATLHNYRLLCLPATFVRDGRICEDCLNRSPWPGVVHRCYRDSMFGSSVLAGSLVLHRLLATFRNHVDLYLPVSSFLRDKYLQAGFPPGRLFLKPNFAPAVPRRQGPGEFFLYAGRISSEKGIFTLISVWRTASTRLVVAGGGPDVEQLRHASSPQVEYLGELPPGEMTDLLRRSRALLLPSLSYEGAPRTVVEAYAAGVPVIASSLGALPELVADGVSGLVVPASDANAWSVAIKRLEDDLETERLGNGAWRLWSEAFSPAQGLANLEEAYRRALAARHGVLPGEET